MRAEGTLPLESDFGTVVRKFCFDFNIDPQISSGRFSFDFFGTAKSLVTTVASENSGLWLAVYDDEDNHWGAVEHSWEVLSCADRLAAASFTTQITPLERQFSMSEDVEEKLRPRFWYFAILACGVEFGEEPVRWSLHAVNQHQLFQTEFSVDERGALMLQLIGVVGFCGIGFTLRQIAQRTHGTEALRSRPLLHLLIMSCVCSGGGCACYAIHNFTFALDGWGIALFDFFGALWSVVGKATMTVLQLLLAKGWALFHSPEEGGSLALTTVALGSIILLSLAAEIHILQFHDDVGVYMYEKMPIAITVLNTLLFMEVWRSLRKTYSGERSDEVQLFHCMVATSSLIFFLSVPVMCVLASSLDPWVRSRYVSRVEVFARLLTTGILAFCLRPSRLERMVIDRLEEGLEPIGEQCDEDDECWRQEADKEPSSSLLDREDSSVALLEPGE